MSVCEMRDVGARRIGHEKEYDVMCGMKDLYRFRSSVG